jgi:hypothetical protein
MTTYAVCFYVIALSYTTASCLLLFICLFYAFSFLSITFSHFSVLSKNNELVWNSNNCLSYLICKLSTYEPANGVLSLRSSSFPQILQSEQCKRAQTFLVFSRPRSTRSAKGRKTSLSLVDHALQGVQKDPKLPCLW